MINEKQLVSIQQAFQNTNNFQDFFQQTKQIGLSKPQLNHIYKQQTATLKIEIDFSPLPPI